MTSADGAVSPEWIGRAPHQEFQRGIRPLLPSKDPFFDPPAAPAVDEPALQLSPPVKPLDVP